RNPQTTALKFSPFHSSGSGSAVYELIRRIRLAVHVVVEQRAAQAAEYPKGNRTAFGKSRSFLVQLNVSHLLISGTGHHAGRVQFLPAILCRRGDLPEPCRQSGYSVLTRRVRR